MTSQESAPKLDDRRPTCVVGIGASAGGLEALERLFDRIPLATGLAYVVVQHLSPDFESLMPELLVRHTKLPVRTAEHGMRVEPDAIYLIPRGKEMQILGERLQLTDKDPRKKLTLPVDIFLESLARDVGPRSIGIILSGTGSDGSRGIEAIGAAGGLVLVQNEESAKFDGMPKNARNTGAVDLCLPPEEMGPILAQYAEDPSAASLIAMTNAPPVDESATMQMLRLLRDNYGIDFSHYKQSTVNRRIERRLLLTGTTDLPSYVEQLARDPRELNALYHDLLIGVTQFFRDRDAFQEMERRILPELLRKLSPEEEVRVWAAGCATGEEAYSLAMLLHEQLTRLERPVEVKIFATDVHQASLDYAAAGFYREEQLAHVSANRRQRYFTKQGDAYQVGAELRQMIVFARHDVLKDAPFTRLHLVTCRNLLIYFEPAAQTRALTLFHFSLKPDGILWLGPSESPGSLEGQFESVDRHWKIYRKTRDGRLPGNLRLPSLSAVRPTLGPPVDKPSLRSSSGDLQDIYDELLAACVPSGLLVDSRRQLVHVFGDGGKFLHHGAGRATSDVGNLLEPGLRTALSGALYRAQRQRTPVHYSDVTVELEGRPEHFQLSIQPLGNGPSPSHFLVTLASIDVNESPRSDSLTAGEASSETINHLEAQLRTSEENLQATVEELEASNEELNATNEELVASNEELQSSNEELHSVNEELYTVNAEYQRKIAELTELTDDMENLLASTNVGVVYLDRDLCIRRLTPRVAEVFNILPQDIGRPFETFRHTIDHPTLGDDLRSVLATGVPVEREVQDRFGAWSLLRILPYNSSTDIEGVVLTLIDIHALKETEQELRDRDEKLRGILDHSPAFVYVKDLEGRYTLCNRRARQVLGVAPEALIGKTDEEVLPRDLAQRIAAHDRRVVETGSTLQVEEKIPRRSRSVAYLVVKYPLRDESGTIFALAGIATNVMWRRVIQTRTRQALKQRDRFLAMLSHELRNPLAAVRNGVQVLAKQPGEPELISEVVDAILGQTEHMTRLLDDLLDISRIAQSKIELNRRAVDLRQVARQSAETVRAAMRDREHDFSFDIADEPIFVHGDPARLQQIQVNLLVNAAKYTPSGGKVCFEIDADDRHATILVRDTGVGMDETTRRQVFDPFFQEQKTVDQSQGGMGVGLTLVRSLVELHDGEINLKSEGVGQGAEFVVRLPRTKAPPQQSDAAAPEAGSLPGLHVLLVEDNDQLRVTTKALLTLNGCRVTAATDGPEALAALEEQTPDVALVDIGLPKMDGYRLAIEIRKQQRLDRMTLVALTGYGRPADRQRAFDAGFDEHYTKPVDIEQLGRLFHRLAAGRETALAASDGAGQQADQPRRRPGNAAR